MGLVQPYEDYKENTTKLFSAFIRIDNTKQRYIGRNVYSLMTFVA